MIHDAYRDTDAAPEALAAAQASEIARLGAEPVYRNEAAGVAVYPDGTRLDWSRHLPRPARQTGTARLADPMSFADYVLRHSTPETAIFADKSTGTFVAVFNGPPSTEQEQPGQVAGRGDWRAVMSLAQGADWAEWLVRDRDLMSQRDFGEHVDALAHTMLEPDGARMIEIATTLTAKTKLDFASRTNLANGEVSFRVEQETQAKAGRAGEIEIPTQFVFRLPLWDGTEPVEITARLRFRASREDGVMMGYRIVRRAAAVDLAFGRVVEEIASIVGDGVPMFLGHASEPLT